MPWPVYSTQFIRVNPPANTTTTYQVPAGMRAVVKHFSSMQTSSHPGFVQLIISGIGVYQFAFQASSLNVSVPLMVVAYQGQTISVWTEPISTHTSVAGFLFDDVALAEDPSLDAVVEAGGPFYRPPDELDAG